MAYCSYSDVGLLLALSFDENSRPTDAQVTDIISLISSEVNMTLNSVGITIPTSGDLFNLLRLRVMQGSAGIVGLSYYGNTESIINSQGDYYTNLYRDFLKDLKENPGVYSSVSGGSLLYISNQVLAGYETEESITDILIGNDWVD
jgi:hypothetical protein